jgi:hypothetical protein
MKRYIILILIIFSSIPIFGQSGSGTLADPFYGNISQSRIWTLSMSPVYVGQRQLQRRDLTIVNGGSLTIDPGVIVIFTQSESDLRITGTGILQAVGTNASKITFTSPSPSANWGHIAFRNNTGTSNLTYCIIERGYSVALTEAGNGGGIFINSGNITISKCIIRNNKAVDSGGGIYSSSSARIENCLIYSNSSEEGVGGGGIFFASGSSATVTNCTIVENTTYSGLGDDIYFESAAAIVKNTIIWRSVINYLSIYFDVTPSSNNLYYCAFIDAYNNSETEISSTFATRINLNISNTASDGPNFLNPTTDLTISPLSPCRDRGSSSATPGTAPPLTDLHGNSRIGPYDIGAYEVQYTRWRTTASTTEWNSASNWDGGVPTSTSNIVIPPAAANYPVLTPGPDFTIGSGRYLIIESGASATLSTLTNNGTLVLFNNASTSASLILNSYTRGTGGTEKVQVLLTGGGTEEEDNFRWHFISTPVASLPVSVFTAATPDVAQYIESRASFSLLQGWVAYDGYGYASGLNTGIIFSTLVPGKGYDYFDYADHTFEFNGLLNTSGVNATLAYTTSIPVAHRGFNLLGNPFHSGLDWDYIINDPSYPANTSKALYFTRDNQQCTYAGGVGIPGDVNGIIPPMQGFFNKTYSAGNSITLPTAARTHNNIHSRYKGEDIIPLVRLEITENAFSDETVVRFDDNAKPDLDYEFDAVKMSVSESHPYLYSVTSGTNFAINAQPFPEEVSEFPIVVNSPADGSHKIIAKQIQGLDTYYIALTDKTTGYHADLKKTPWLSFIAPKGKITDRFILKVSTVPTGIEDPTITDGKFNIYQAYDFIIIEPLDELWNGRTGNVRIMDLTGKSVSDHSNMEFQTKSLIQIPAPERKGIYFVEVKSGNLRHTGKVVIR